MVRVTSLPDVQGGMRPAGSMVSVESSGSGRTGVSYRVHPSIDSEAVVEVINNNNNNNNNNNDDDDDDDDDDVLIPNFWLF